MALLAHSRVLRMARCPTVNRWSKDVVGSIPIPGARPARKVQPLTCNEVVEGSRSLRRLPCWCSSKVEQRSRKAPGCGSIPLTSSKLERPKCERPSSSGLDSRLSIGRCGSDSRRARQVPIV